MYNNNFSQEIKLFKLRLVFKKNLKRKTQRQAEKKNYK